MFKDVGYTSKAKFNRIDVNLLYWFSVFYNLENMMSKCIKLLHKKSLPIKGRL